MGSYTFLCISALILFILFIYKHITRNFNYWGNLQVTYLAPIPFFGNIFNVTFFKQSLGEFIKDVYYYADTRFTGFFMFDQPFLLIRDPELIKNVLIKDCDYFESRTLAQSAQDTFGSQLLFSLRNQQASEIRSKLSPLFSSAKLKSMMPLFLEVAKDMKLFLNETLNNNQGVIEIRQLSSNFTTDVISTCAFGINSKCFENKKSTFSEISRQFFRYTMSRSVELRAFFAAPCLVKLFGLHFMDKNAIQFMASLFKKHMHERMRSNVKRGDLLDMIIEMKESNSESLDDELLVAQAIQFFLAGFETTGNALSYALYELALNPEVQNKLRDKIKAVLSNNATVSYEAIAEIKYLDNVISETLRKNPILTFLDRRCSKPYKIPNSNVTIKKGIPIYISLLGLGMDPKYFPEPDVFEPDRFSNGSKGAQTPFTYLPFGGGPRNCIGARFALISMKVMLVTIISNYELTVHPKTPKSLQLDPKTSFLSAPKGEVIYLNFKKYLK